MSNVGAQSIALYGTDLWCLGRLDPNMSEVSGSLLVLQSCCNRLNMRRGGCLDRPNDGLDLPGWLSKNVSDSDIARLRIEIPAELEKDERVRSAQVTALVFDKATRKIDPLQIKIVTADGPFSLTLSVSTVTVAALGIS